jgi:hypothetical protein
MKNQVKKKKKKKKQYILGDLCMRFNPFVRPIVLEIVSK